MAICRALKYLASAEELEDEESADTIALRIEVLMSDQRVDEALKELEKLPAAKDFDLDKLRVGLPLKVLKGKTILIDIIMEASAGERQWFACHAGHLQESI